MNSQQVRSLAGKLMEEWQNIDAVAEVLGCQRKMVRLWHLEYMRDKSEKTISSKQQPGRPKKLSENQLNIIQDIIFTKTPDSMHHRFLLWSNKVIRDTIFELFATNLSLGTINALTKNMGIIRRNIFKAMSAHQDTETERWVKHRYPFIKKLAQEQHARVFFIHEERVNATKFISSPSRIHSKTKDHQGHHPPVETVMLSAICPRNSQRFKIYTRLINAQVFIGFMKALMHDIDRPLFLIAEYPHRQFTLEIDDFLSSTTNKISLFFLPNTNENTNLKSA